MGSNCVVSASIGCLYCFKGCNAEKVRNEFTFIPPQKSYTVDSNEEKRIVYLLEALELHEIYRKAAEASEIHWLTTRTGSRVPLAWLRRERHEDAEPLVVLHCHGNATDIGMMMGPYYELSKVLGIEVCGVEYSGYGAATGKASAANTYADVEAAYDYLVSRGVSPKRIVAYGQSVGSGPATFLASKRPLGGLILHSPMMSGIKVVDPKPDVCCRPSCVWSCFDFYPNDRRVKQLLCPLLIMHGQRDDIIPFYHGYRLHKACPKAYRWPAYFPQRAGHNDLVETDSRGYFGEVSSFLFDVKGLAEGRQVEPPSDKPPQLHMALKASEAEPRQVEMAHTEFFEHGPTEVQCGPEDGRYEDFRKGNFARLGPNEAGAQAE